MKVKRDGLFVCSFCACAGRTMLLHFSAFDQTGREFFMSKGVLHIKPKWIIKKYKRYVPKGLR